ncbi:MAG: DUF1549 domain-containing protein [Planctomycetota bacterium]|nr:DUF1549 domain-containing protein [Planctomycetota bacterium]
MRPVCRTLIAMLVVAVPLHAEQKPDKTANVATHKISFERHVRPILKANCFPCHGEGEKLEGGLDLRLRRLIARGGESGPGFQLQRPAESELLVRVVAQEMPPADESRKLTTDEIEIIRRWIEAGAPTDHAEPESMRSGFVITQSDREYWAFQPIANPPLPSVRRGALVRNPIDAFVLARLERDGFRFADEAIRRTLIRRATFDLLGLPPAPHNVDAFASDNRGDAYERLVDQLLASPHYGERWGRHWLDVAGYADSEGYTIDDAERSDAFKFRDYVIRALNAGKPFDQFVREQLAGDELVTPPFNELDATGEEKLIATGFLRMAPDGTGSDNSPAARNKVIAETVKIVSTSLLGLTVGCAECHHHRYDPISQPDYYSFRAIFDPAFDWQKWQAPKSRRISLYSPAEKQRADAIEVEAKKLDKTLTAKQNAYIEATFQKELAKLPKDIHDAIKKARATAEKKRSKEQVALLKKHPTVNVTAGSLYLYDSKAAADLKKMAAVAQKLRDTKPKEEFIRALAEAPNSNAKSFVFNRGDFEQPKQEVQPGELSILSLPESAKPTVPVNEPKLRTTGRRSAYATWLTNGRHPLLARVIVNRVWMHHFGRGLVETAGDFGALGSRPSHPELLDWLSHWFMTHDWSLKDLHRLIMTSATYRHGLNPDERLAIADPDGRLLGSRLPRRLEAEALRDSILELAGRLNRKPYGPAVPVMADRVGRWVIGKENLNAGRPGAILPMNGEDLRRSVYIQVRRSRPLSALQPFDLPEMEPNCELRAVSTVSTQSLMLMNSDFIAEQSEQFADRVMSQAGDTRSRIVHAWKLTFASEPSEADVAEAQLFVDELTVHFKSRTPANGKPTSAKRAWSSFCQTLLSSNAFLYVD